MSDERTQFGVKHGRKVTTFSSIKSAYEYWTVTIGSVLLIRDSKTNWWRLIQ